MKALGSHLVDVFQRNSEGKALNLAQKSATARESINASIFGTKPLSSADMEYNKSISSHGQDGQKPVNNPKPCFHIAIPRSGRPYTIESREDKTSGLELI